MEDQVGAVVPSLERGPPEPVCGRGSAERYVAWVGRPLRIPSVSVAPGESASVLTGIRETLVDQVRNHRQHPDRLVPRLAKPIHFRERSPC